MNSANPTSVTLSRRYIIVLKLFVREINVMTPGHTWLDCIGKVPSTLGGVVAPVRDERDERGVLCSAGSSGSACLVMLMNGINEVCSV